MSDDLAPLVSTELLDQLGDAVTVVGFDWRYRYVSPGAAVIIGKSADEVVGCVAWDIFPEVLGTPEHAAMLRAMEQRTVEKVVWFFDTVGRWYEQQAIPTAAGLVIVVNDVTNRELTVRRSEQLLQIGEALAQTLTVEDVSRVVGERALPLTGAAGGSIVLVDEARQTAHALGWSGMDESIGTRWAEFPLGPATPSIDAYRTGEPVVLHSIEEIEARYPHLADDLRRVDRHTLAAFPMSGAGTREGALVLSFPTGRVLHAADIQVLGTVAAMCAQALARAQLYDAERRSIDALQRSLLPPDVPAIAGLDIAVRYRSSEGTVEVGGDWFDVIPLPAGTVGLVMGDVEGHDLAAAALMGLIRSAVRAYAVEDHPPAVIMELANEFLAGLARGRIVTISYSQVHPAERLITTVSAGHLPSMIASDSGIVAEIPTDVGPPLGVTSGGMLWPEQTSTLPLGALMALYTDGLVESRREDISTGLDRVRAVLGGGLAEPVEEVADDLLACRSAYGEDDIALVVARVTSDTSEVDARTITRRLPPSPASVSLARRFIRQLLVEWGVDGETAPAAELAVSELVTNAARHSEDTIEVRLVCTPDALRLAVSDSSHRMPSRIDVVDDESTAGRGLLLVEAVASRWGVDSYGLGKIIWCEFDL